MSSVINWHNQFQPGDRVVALYDFRTQNTAELSLCKGDVLVIQELAEIEYSDRPVNQTPAWFWAIRNSDGKRGLIPGTCIQKYSQSPRAGLPTLPTNNQALGEWYHGNITREQTESILTPHENGLFLVRKSTNFTGDYTLCVVFEGKVEHYRIEKQGSKLSVDGEVFFDNLNELVEYYLKDADGLCCRLTRPKVNPNSNKLSPIHNNVPRTSSPQEPLPTSQILHGCEIPEADVKLQESIGGGDFSTVYKGIYRKQVVAVKSLKVSDLANFQKEASLMMKLNHKNLVQFKGIVRGKQSTYIIMEFMARGSLELYLQSRGRSVLTKQNLIKFALDVTEGMSYLEDNRVVHRDLAARNILLNEESVAKVSDFGLAYKAEDLAQRAGKGENKNDSVLPIKWTAPEALRDQKFTSKSDMWSFGVLLWEIYSYGRNPYPRIPVKDVAAMVEKGYRMTVPDDCPQEIGEIMISAWNANPDKRPSFKDALTKIKRYKDTLPR